MKRPAPRTLAYLGLWLVLLAVIAWRRVPEAVVTQLPEEPAQPALRVDLNTDSWERLTLIEGIGETLARRIVAAREARGGFHSLREVMDLPGVPDRAITDAQAWLGLSDTAPPQPAAAGGP